MGRQGALAYWLAQMLSLVTGNLDRSGGNILPARGIPAMGLVPDQSDRRESRWGAYRPPRGTPPGSLLADMILDDVQPIRALVVLAGNPLLSIAGGERLRDALGQLDLLVCIDFYRNATAELADWALPAADWFEREDLNYFVQGVQRIPYLQWTDRVVPPTHERQEDWWILSRIQQAMGLPSLFDLPEGDALQALWAGRLAEGGSSLDALRRAEGGVVVLPEASHGGFLERVGGPDGFDCCPDELMPTLERADELLARMRSEPRDQLKLITRRTHHMLNSSLQNLETLKTANGARTNPLFMNPGDAKLRGLEAGQRVRVHNEEGELVAELALDPRLREGVVAMSHGFGNERTPGMPIARMHPGVNVNQLSPSGTGSFDPISSMGQLTGIRVTVSSD
jgi:anaerobic selenocysteine-containing dehydrogenase